MRMEGKGKHEVVGEGEEKLPAFLMARFSLAE
jgi:hypothetical protein